MPELPEVETVRAGLAVRVVGRVVEDAQVLRDYSVRRHDGGPLAFVAALVGARIAAAVRRGKFLWFPLVGGPVWPDAASWADAESSAACGESGTSRSRVCAQLRREPDPEFTPKSRTQPGVPRMALLAHLGMSGQFRLSSADDVDVRLPVGTSDSEADRPRAHRESEVPLARPRAHRESEIPSPHPHCRVRLRLSGGLLVDFIDQRTFGHLSVHPLVPTPDGGPGGHGSDLALLPTPVLGIARDLLDPGIDVGQVAAKIHRKRTDIKRAILDQGVVSGVGNIYADEALWAAKVHFARQTDRMRPRDIRAVLDAAANVMRAALAQGGTSFDAMYVDVDGNAGYFERALAAYGREGLPCPRCGTPIRRDPFMNRSSFTCPRCQRRPHA